MDDISAPKFSETWLPSGFSEVLNIEVAETEATNIEVARSEWEYIPDETPLPNFAVEKIWKTFGEHGRQIRQRNGTYPVIDAITRFFNYLLAGSPPGQRRASGKLLVKMGLNSRTKDRDEVISLLVASGLIAKGDYRIRERSTLWLLREVKLYQEHRRSLLASSK